MILLHSHIWEFGGVIPYILGCLTGFEPVMSDPQSEVLPLNYRHHVLPPDPQSGALPLSYWHHGGRYSITKKFENQAVAGSA
jgi:hypothetical protein